MPGRDVMTYAMNLTKDIPAGVIAAGNPCRVMRDVTDQDKAKYPVYTEQPPGL